MSIVPSATYWTRCTERLTSTDSRFGAAMLARVYFSTIRHRILSAAPSRWREILATRHEHPDSLCARWWETPGSVRASLLRLDGQVGVVVNAEKHVVPPVVGSGEVAGQLEQIAQRMGMGTDDGVFEQSDLAPGFEPAKPGFTRESGSFRRQVSPHGVQDPGE
jgi:hypothetical protein